MRFDCYNAKAPHSGALFFHHITMNIRQPVIILFGSIIIALLAPTASAWTGPTALPPNNNASEPINISGVQQFKPGIIGANIINIYGASQYLNFGNSTGSSGFGLRNNGGIIEFKHSGGAWAAMGNSPWNGTTSNDIYYSAGDVRIGAPGEGEAELHVSGDILQDNGNTMKAKSSTGVIETWIWPRHTDNYTYFQFGSSGLRIRNNASAVRMAITNAGNVGIGTTTPSARLTVGSAGGSANNAYYDIGAARIAANESMYSYGSICSGNSSGNCQGTGGTVMRGDGIQFPDGTLQSTAATASAAPLSGTLCGLAVSNAGCYVTYTSLSTCDGLNVANGSCPSGYTPQQFDYSDGSGTCGAPWSGRILSVRVCSKI